MREDSVLLKDNKLLKFNMLCIFFLPSIDPFLQDKKITVRFPGQTKFVTGSFQVSVKVL